MFWLFFLFVISLFCYIFFNVCHKKLIEAELLVK